MRPAVLRVKRHLRTRSESPRARRAAAAVAAAAPVLPQERLCRRPAARPAV